jgi:HEAT repeat protein
MVQYASGDGEVRRKAVLKMGAFKEAALETLLEALGDSSWRVREAACQVIKDLGSLAIPHLLQLIGEEKPNRRNAAVKCLKEMGTQAAQDLLREAQKGQEREKILSLVVLGELKSKDVVDGIISILEDKDESLNVRYEAAEALGKIGDRRAVLPLIKALNEDEWLQFPALLALGSLGDVAAVGPLINLLSSEMLVQPIIESLGKIADERALETVACFLKDADDVKKTALMATAAIARKSLRRSTTPFSRRIFLERLRPYLNDSAALSFLAQCLRDEDILIKKDAVFLLSLTGTLEGFSILTKDLLDDELEEVFEEGLRQLGGEKEKFDLLLSEDNPKVQVALLRVLNELNDPRALKLARQLLGSNDVAVKRTAVLVLGEAGTDEDAVSLLPLLEESNGEVREAAVEALSLRCFGKLSSTFSHYLNSDNQTLRRSVTQVLANLGEKGGKEVFNLLLLALKDKDEIVRREAIVGLGKFKEKAVDVLILALSDEKKLVRESAIKALGETKSSQAFEPLVSLLSSEEKWQRYFAARALGKIGDKRASKYLRKMLADPEINVVVAALEALSRLHDTTALEEVLSMLNRPDEALRKAAVTLLGEINMPGGLKYLAKMAGDSHWGVRAEVAVSLGKLGDKRALGVLISLIEDENGIVKEAALNALLKLKDLSVSEKEQLGVALFQATFDTEVGDFVLDALTKFACGNKDEFLKVALSLGVSERLQALKVLERLGSAGKQGLLRLLKDDEPVVRRAAVLAIGNLDERDVKEALNRVLQSEEGEVKEAARKVLGTVCKGGSFSGAFQQ